MSAYQVDYETIGRVLKAISKAGCYGPRYKQIEKLKQQYEKNAGIVFDQLLELNRLSLKGRYEDCESMFFDVDMGLIMNKNLLWGSIFFIFTTTFLTSLILYILHLWSI